MHYADMERKLGEIDRARALYIHCSQMCDPKSNKKFWEQWKEFEIQHGNEDTVREMLRIKRSVQAAYNVEFNFMTAQMVVSDGSSKTAPPVAADSMKSLEAAASSRAVEPAKATLVTAKTKGNIQFVK